MNAQGMTFMLGGVFRDAETMIGFVSNIMAKSGLTE